MKHWVTISAVLETADRQTDRQTFAYLVKVKTNIPNSDYLDLICIHIHLEILSLSQIYSQGFLASLQFVCYLHYRGNYYFQECHFLPTVPGGGTVGLQMDFFLPISINFITFEKSPFDMKFFSLGHYCMYTSHSLSQIGMDKNNGQIIDFWVSRASKQLNMSTSIKIWILMYYIHLDLDTFYICLDLFGSQNILTISIWIPKFGKL